METMQKTNVIPMQKGGIERKLKEPKFTIEQIGELVVGYIQEKDAKNQVLRLRSLRDAIPQSTCGGCKEMCSVYALNNVIDKYRRQDYQRLSELIDEVDYHIRSHEIGQTHQRIVKEDEQKLSQAYGRAVGFP